MTDRIFQGFLESALADASRINAESDVARIVPAPDSGNPPRIYHGRLREVEHYERCPDGTFRVSDREVAFRIEFPADYCRSVDFNLQLRVVQCDPRIVHPNIKGGMVCLGNGFKPSTRIRGVVQHFYQILSSRVVATDNAFDAAAAEFYLKKHAEIQSLQAKPLWRRPVAARIRVREIDQTQDQRGDT
jgi:ubiquitin-protein ligase